MIPLCHSQVPQSKTRTHSKTNDTQLTSESNNSPRSPQLNLTRFQPGTATSYARDESRSCNSLGFTPSPSSSQHHNGPQPNLQSTQVTSLHYSSIANTTNLLENPNVQILRFPNDLHRSLAPSTPAVAAICGSTLEFSKLYRDNMHCDAPVWHRMCPESHGFPQGIQVGERQPHYCVGILILALILWVGPGPGQRFFYWHHVAIWQPKFQLGCK
jgi:hypothetical protein